MSTPASLPSPAKCGFIIRKNIHLKHETCSFICLTDTCQWGMMTRAARIIGTSQHGAKADAVWFRRREGSTKNDCQARGRERARWRNGAEGQCRGHGKVKFIGGTKQRGTPSIAGSPCGAGLRGWVSAPWGLSGCEWGFQDGPIWDQT